jgi:sugar transferase (PEP-CTERM system associated)
MRKSVIIIGGDILIAILSIYFTFFIFISSIPRPAPDSMSKILLGQIVFIFVVITTTFFSELYNKRKIKCKKQLFQKIASSIILAFVILSIFQHFFPKIIWSYNILIVILISFGIFQFIWHYFFKTLIRVSGVANKVIILGVGSLASQIGETLEKTNHDNILVGYIRTDGERSFVHSEKIIGNINRLVETSFGEKVRKIIISLSERRGTLPINELLQCKFSGIEIIDSVSFYEELTGKLMVENTNPGWFIFSRGFGLTSFMSIRKRVFDIIFSLFGILLTLPLFPIICLLIKLDSPGPVLYRQVRVGEKEKKFEIYKFRTMEQDAEVKTGAVWAGENDPRITRAGKILRKSRLDEIPQFFNVLKGDMSFVGPRPERPEFVKNLKEQIPYYSKRHFVKPGITGWAQVNYAYAASIDDSFEKLRYDLYYIKHYSLWFDFKIILLTIKVFVFGSGAR